MISYTVARRTHEIGIRVALGATRRDVFPLVMSRGIGLAAAGVVIGLAGAAGATRTLTTLLYEVSPYDAVSFSASPWVCSLCRLLAAHAPGVSR